jgi:SAM-dependent methyltransferase
VAARSGGIKGGVLSRFTRDMEGMGPWLPARIDSFLDIGCGSGRLAVLLAQHYGGAVDVHLIDGDRRVEAFGKEQVGYAPTTPPWNDRAAAAELVRAKVPAARVFDYPPDPRLTIPVDLIVSTKSWGHHYGADVYLGLARRSLRPGGRIIMDLRDSTHDPRAGDGLGVMKAGGFRVVVELERTTVKTCRTVLEWAN